MKAHMQYSYYMDCDVMEYHLHNCTNASYARKYKCIMHNEHFRNEYRKEAYKKETQSR